MLNNELNLFFVNYVLFIIKCFFRFCITFSSKTVEIRLLFTITKNEYLLKKLLFVDAERRRDLAVDKTCARRLFLSNHV